MRSTHTLFILALIGAQSLVLNLTASAPAEDKLYLLQKDRMLTCYNRLYASISSTNPDDEFLSPDDMPRINEKISTPLNNWLKTSMMQCDLLERKPDLAQVIVDEFKKIVMSFQCHLHAEYLKDIGEYFLGISHTIKTEGHIPVLTETNWSYIQTIADFTQNIARARLVDLAMGPEHCMSKREIAHHRLINNLITQLRDRRSFDAKSYMVLILNEASVSPYELRGFSAEIKKYLRANSTKIPKILGESIVRTMKNLITIETNLPFDDNHQLAP